jgi:hypothetical protein
MPSVGDRVPKSCFHLKKIKKKKKKKKKKKRKKLPKLLLIGIYSPPFFPLITLLLLWLRHQSLPPGHFLLSSHFPISFHLCLPYPKPLPTTTPKGVRTMSLRH